MKNLPDEHLQQQLAALYIQRDHFIGQLDSIGRQIERVEAELTRRRKTQDQEAMRQRMLNEPIETLGLSRPTLDRLKAGGTQRVRELLSTSAHDLTERYQLAPLQRQELVDRLNRWEYRLATARPDPMR